MKTNQVFSSLSCSILVTLVLLYIFSFIVTAVKLNVHVVFWVAFISAIVSVFMNFIAVLSSEKMIIHGFFIYGIFLAFGMLPLCFIPEYTKFIGSNIGMTVFAILHMLISGIGFISHWKLVYDGLKLS